ncbi:unnamed protein product [Effrenium voratum]|uniref:Uncharacterized protein n=1 Tax=Effrenium voratum TaxID=2562239 RepID=A0AA36IC46_9DINO|nr:unnamed protein product [Effrenium voratum]
MAAPGPPLSQVFPQGQAAPPSPGPQYRSAYEEPIYLPPLRVTAPRPRQPGGTEFYGAVPKHSATFAWSELCATPGPEAALAPVPQVPMKSWYNSYVYMPEQTTHDDRQFLQRFVKGPDGEWIDVVKANRLLEAMDAAQQRQIREEAERDMVLAGMRGLSGGFGGGFGGLGGLGLGFGGSGAGAEEADGSDHLGSGVHRTHYMDPYSGEELIACKGHLQTREEIMQEWLGASPGAVVRLRQPPSPLALFEVRSQQDDLPTHV